MQFRFLFLLCLQLNSRDVEKGNVPDYYEFELVNIKEDGSEEVIHRVVPVLKYWELTDRDLIERKLYPLLPLQIFLLRDKLKRFANKSDGKREVIQEIKNLTENIITEVKRLADEGKLMTDDDDRIITALNRLIKYLNKKYNLDKNLNREVDTVIKSVFTTLKEEGKVEVVEKMILKDKPLEEIIELSGLTEKKIKEVAKKLSKELVTN